MSSTIVTEFIKKSAASIYPVAHVFFLTHGVGVNKQTSFRDDGCRLFRVITITDRQTDSSDYNTLQCCAELHEYCKHQSMERNESRLVLTLSRPLLPHSYKNKASCARPG